MNDNVIRYYTSETRDGEIIYAATLRGTIVCASYPVEHYEQINLVGVAQLLTKQLIKAHVLESLDGEPSEALYQACIHVAEGVTIDTNVKWNHHRGKFATFQNFVTSLKKRNK